MFKKIILIFIFLCLLNSCGRKNELEYQVLIERNSMTFDYLDKVLKVSEENEIYQ